MMTARRTFTWTAQVTLAVLLVLSAAELAVGETGPLPPASAVKLERCRPACPLIYAPICAWNGAGHRKSFDNECLLEVHNCEMRNAGNPTLNLVTNGPCI